MVNSVKVCLMCLFLPLGRCNVIFWALEILHYIEVPPKNLFISTPVHYWLIGGVWEAQILRFYSVYMYLLYLLWREPSDFAM